MADVVENFKRIEDMLGKVPARFNIAPGKKPLIVAVSKNHAAEKIIPLLESGHRIFGENRVQEAHAKWPGLKQKYPGIELHLIGPLQTNKAREALEIFDVIETVDREKIAKVLSAELKKINREIDFLVQVNTGEEPQKAGIAPGAADEFIKFCLHDLRLPVKGLMCIPPVGEPATLHFGLLRKIAERNALGILSMGMSADFEIAAAMGATHMRIGSAIFGERKVDDSMIG